MVGASLSGGNHGLALANIGAVWLILDVVTMRRLFGWSEFLATFFMLSLVTLVARPALLAIGR